MGLTITEGLAEIKTIGKRLASKRAFVSTYLGRQEGLKDPLANEGGSREAIARERQSILDLEERIVGIRRAIQAANVSNTITVEGVTRTIADWLVWRREVAAGQQAFLAVIRRDIANARREAQQKGYAIVPSTESAREITDIIVNVDEREVSKESETMEAILGALDGQLSLKNATVLIEI